ncbi:hypothetical protein LCGC14_2084360, partial [marine sediment metagenome]
TVWQDFEEQKPLTKTEAISIIGSGYMEESPDFDNFMTDGHFDLEAYQKEVDKIAEEVYNKFAERANNTLFKFCYSDNEGPYESMLEHGHLFEKLKHLQISHH